MLRMLELTADNKKVFVKIMIYNGQAEFIETSPLKVKTIRAGGSTNFVAVFQKLKDLMKVRAPLINMSIDTALTALMHCSS